MEKNAKSKEKLNLYEVKNKYTRKKINKNNNNKERIRKEQSDKKYENNHTKESHSHGHFNRKDKILVNNFISKSTA